MLFFSVVANYSQPHVGLNAIQPVKLEKAAGQGRIEQKQIDQKITIYWCYEHF